MPRSAAAAVFLAVAVAGFSPARAGGAKSPYAGEERRAIKSLSPEEVRGLLSGEGLGFAKAAELNHHPGPVHVLALAAGLNLTEEQRRTTEALYRRMREEAVELGRQIVDKEKALDERFAAGRIDEAALRSLVGEIARLRGALRVVHLKYHLRMKRLLTPHQIASYDRLRGYAAGGGMEHGHRGH